MRRGFLSSRVAVQDMHVEPRSRRRRQGYSTIDRQRQRPERYPNTCQKKYQWLLINPGNINKSAGGKREGGELIFFCWVRAKGKGCRKQRKQKRWAQTSGSRRIYLKTCLLIMMIREPLAWKKECEIMRGRGIRTEINQAKGERDVYDWENSSKTTTSNEKTGLAVDAKKFKSAKIEGKTPENERERRRKQTQTQKRRG